MADIPRAAMSEHFAVRHADPEPILGALSTGTLLDEPARVDADHQKSGRNETHAPSPPQCATCPQRHESTSLPRATLRDRLLGMNDVAEGRIGATKALPAPGLG